MHNAGFDQTIDLTGVVAPMPILHAKRELKNLRSGQVLRVLAQGSTITRDFQDFARLTGITLKVEVLEENLFEFFLQKR